MNCINCGHPLSSSKCEYCGTVYPDFKEPEPETIEYCDGKPAFFTDFDIETLGHKLMLECRKCGYRTKVYTIPPEDMFEAGDYDYLRSPAVQDAIAEFDTHIERRKSFEHHIERIYGPGSAYTKH